MNTQLESLKNQIGKYTFICNFGHIILLKDILTLKYDEKAEFQDYYLLVYTELDFELLLCAERYKKDDLLVNFKDNINRHKIDDVLGYTMLAYLNEKLNS